MATQVPAQTVAPREAAERLTLLHPTRAYAVTRNPFAIPAILPLLVACMIGVWVAVTLNADRVTTAGGLMVLGTGLLLISAINLRGSLTLTHDGISFIQGKRQLTAGWENVRGLVSKPDCGLCLDIANPDMNTDEFKSPGGLRAKRGVMAQIPLRMFGDRQYSILYDIRERLPQDRYQAVLSKAQRSPRTILVVYAVVVAICAAAMLVDMWVLTH